MKLSIRTRIMLLSILSVVLLFIAMLFITYRVFSHAIYGGDVIEKFDRELFLRAGRVGSEIASVRGPFVMSPDQYTVLFESWIGSDLFLNPAYGQLTDYPERFGETSLITVRSSSLEGRFIPLSRETHRSLESGKPRVETLEGIFSYPIRVVSMRVPDAEGHTYLLQMGMSMRHVSTTMFNVTISFFTVGVFFIMLISLLGYYLVKKSFKPVRDIVAAAKSITAEDLSRRLPPVDSADEIGELADTLNDMIERIERSFDQARQFSDDVSHELKTPLTVIRGELEVALRGDRSPEEYRKTLQSLLEETEKLGAIMENLLFLSRMDSKRFMVSLGEVELDGLIMSSYESFCDTAAKAGIRLSITKLDEITIRGDSGLLRRLLDNLVQNALKYTPAGGAVDIALERRPEDGDDHPGMTARVTVSDTGIGIPRTDLPHIFDRFYRVDKSRSLKTGGTGLGLTIVKKILDIHGARVTVKSRRGAGTRFILHFP